MHTYTLLYMIMNADTDTVKIQHKHIITEKFISRPDLLPANSKVLMVLDYSDTGIVSSNPSLGMDICLRFSELCCLSVCLSVCAVFRGLVMGRSPIQGVLPKCLNGFTVSEVNSGSEEARGPNS
jgi:hypothetical protein